MDDLIRAIAPVAIASVALQQLLELLDPVLDLFVRRYKKSVLSILALIVALALSFGLGLRLLTPLGFSGPGWLDAVVTALFLTGGTKAFNDLIKWLGYKKEAARAGLTESQARRV
ncbi:MAG: hypothetical protein AB1449_07450 [Chloroflexota bacterium]